jgi:hypothetical protein
LIVLWAAETVAAVAGVARSEDVSRRFGLTGSAEATGLLGDDNATNSTNDFGHDFGGLLRYGIAPRWSVGVSYDNIDLYGQFGTRHHPETLLGNVLFHVNPESRCVVTLLAGAGVSSTLKHGAFDNATVRGGLGLEYFFTPFLAAGPRVGFTWIANGRHADNEYGIPTTGFWLTAFL